jgi:hypothetical protein
MSSHADLSTFEIWAQQTRRRSGMPKDSKKKRVAFARHLRLVAARREERKQQRPQQREQKAER